MTSLPPDIVQSSRALQRLHLGFSAGGIAASALLAGPGFTAAYALGAALEAMNFRALCTFSARVLSGQLDGRGAWSGLLRLRLFVVFAVMGMALLAGAHPIGLLLGVSTVVPAVLVGAWWLGPPVDPDAPALPPEDPAWEHWSIWRADVVPPAEDEEDGAPTMEHRS